MTAIDERFNVPERAAKSKNVKVNGRMAAIMAGHISVEELDDEELARGQVRAENGTFTGRPPGQVPKAFHDEIVRRLLKRGDELMRESYLDSIKTFREIASDPNNSPADRLKAAQWIAERVAGKTPDRIHVKQEDRVETLFSEILQDQDGLNPRAPQIVQGTVVSSGDIQQISDEAERDD